MPDLPSTIRRRLRRAVRAVVPSDEPRPRRQYLADAAAGIARVRAARPGTRPMILATWPFDPENPFQALLTSRVEEAGIVPIAMDRLADLDDPVALPGLVALGASDDIDVVLHLHWLARVLRGIESGSEGRERIGAFVAALDAAQATGGRIAWTVHNVLPHDTAFPELDLELRRAVVERADLVHVLSAGTVEAAADQYAIRPEKVFVLPHPSYLGAYPDDATDADARAHYALAADDIVFAFVGNIRPYKGLDDLLAAFESLGSSPRSDGRRRCLLIAGRPLDHPSIAVLLERAAAHPDVVVDARRIPAEEMSVPLRASDVIVLPYRASLTSGALLLALSFGRPVIAAASPHVRETVGDAEAILVPAADRAALARALLDADRLLTTGARDAALATARRLDPAAISRRYARALRERLGTDAN